MEDWPHGQVVEEVHLAEVVFETARADLENLVEEVQPLGVVEEPDLLLYLLVVLHAEGLLVDHRDRDFLHPPTEDPKLVLQDLEDQHVHTDLQEVVAQVVGQHLLLLELVLLLDLVVIDRPETEELDVLAEEPQINQFNELVLLFLVRLVPSLEHTFQTQDAHVSTCLTFLFYVSTFSGPNFNYFYANGFLVLSLIKTRKTLKLKFICVGSLNQCNIEREFEFEHNFPSI